MMTTTTNATTTAATTATTAATGNTTAKTLTIFVTTSPQHHLPRLLLLPLVYGNTFLVIVDVFLTSPTGIEYTFSISERLFKMTNHIATLDQFRAQQRIVEFCTRHYYH
jgi:hypothetical protein